MTTTGRGRWWPCWGGHSNVSLEPPWGWWQPWMRGRKGVIPLNSHASSASLSAPAIAKVSVGGGSWDPLSRKQQAQAGSRGTLQQCWLLRRKFHNETARHSVAPYNSPCSQHIFCAAHTQLRTAKPSSPFSPPNDCGPTTVIFPNSWTRWDNYGQDATILLI